MKIHRSWLGHKVECIDNSNSIGLTIGKFYTIKEINGEYLCVVGDDGKIGWHDRATFKM